MKPSSASSVPYNVSSSYFNILSLDGAGLNGLMLAELLYKIELLAFNISTELDTEYGVTGKVPVVNGHTYNTNTVRIKDMFNMITSISVSSFIAVGLTIPSPEDPTKPAYSSSDLV